MTHRDDLAARVAAAADLASTATRGQWASSGATIYACREGSRTDLLPVRETGEGEGRRLRLDADPDDLDLMAAAPDLAALVAELWAAVEQERADLSRAWECVGEERARAEMAEDERDEARRDLARLRAMLPDGGPTWGEHCAGLGAPTHTEED